MATARVQLAERLVRETGDRLTTPRVQVLVALLGAGRALTHHEIETRLARGYGINRVTVYRVLEWLTRRGIAHKIAGEDRVWRFNVAGGGHAGQAHHAHFVCNGCGRVLCLEDVREPPEPPLPAGFLAHDVELTIKGVCDACGEQARRRGRRARARA